MKRKNKNKNQRLDSKGQKTKKVAAKMWRATRIPHFSFLGRYAVSHIPYFTEVYSTRRPILSYKIESYRTLNEGKEGLKQTLIICLDVCYDVFIPYLQMMKIYGKLQIWLLWCFPQKFQAMLLRVLSLRVRNVYFLSRIDITMYIIPTVKPLIIITNCLL